MKLTTHGGGEARLLDHTSVRLAEACVDLITAAVTGVSGGIQRV